MKVSHFPLVNGLFRSRMNMIRALWDNMNVLVLNLKNYFCENLYLSSITPFL